jgi:2-polyprenyl-3-methyl-5-hydroxy-6-metoxy-1,4-benzoquinol methylase
VLAGASGDLEVNRCKSCGFVYLANWEHSLRQSERLYDYYERLSDEDLTRRHSPENRARQQKLLRKLAAYTPGRKLLDVGCGDGQLLQTATDEGWDAVGIDLSGGAVRLCERRGLSAFQTDFFDSSLDTRRFDVVVMSELIEHVPSPQRFLTRAEELLEMDGVLYLTTPNFGSLARRILGENWSVIHAEHIGYFERSTLRKIISEDTGFREIRIEANNIAPSTLLAWRRRRGTEAAGSTAEAHREMRRSVDQRLRRAVQRSPALDASKDLLNRAISRAGLGDTLVAWLQKPPAKA